MEYIQRSMEGRAEGKEEENVRRQKINKKKR